MVVDGSKKVVEFSSQGLQKNTLRYTFKSRDLHALFDRQWHKLSISVQNNIVSIYMDCKLIERRLTDERPSVDPSGRTLITTRMEDGRPVDVRPTLTFAKFLLSFAKSTQCHLRIYQFLVQSFYYSSPVSRNSVLPVRHISKCSLKSKGI